MLTHNEIIDRLGGTVELAKRLGVQPQRVSNWRRRGIPPAVQLRHQALFAELANELAAPPIPAPAAPLNQAAQPAATSEAGHAAA